MDWLLDAFAIAHRRVLAYGAAHPDCAGMGSATLAAVHDGLALNVCHAGDVRCYVLAHGTLRVITEDHSAVGGLVKAGLMTESHASLSSARGHLEQAIGMGAVVNPATVRRRPEHHQSDLPEIRTRPRRLVSIWFRVPGSWTDSGAVAERSRALFFVSSRPNS